MKTPADIYLAAPFFNAGERSTNAALLSELEAAGLAVFYPARDGILLRELIEAGSSYAAAARQVWQCDRRAIADCRCLVAVLDGRTPDEGVAVEVGLAAGFGRSILGYSTEERTCFSFGVHPMLSAPLDAVFVDAKELTAAAVALVDSIATSKDPCA